MLCAVAKINKSKLAREELRSDARRRSRWTWEQGLECDVTNVALRRVPWSQLELPNIFACANANNAGCRVRLHHPQPSPTIPNNP